MKPLPYRTASFYFACAVVVLGLTPAALADLRGYVERPDDTFTFQAAETQQLSGATAHHLRLTSQTWQGIQWQHWLTVIRPETVSHPDTALLFITGGSNRDGGAPRMGNERERMLVDAAVKSGSVVAVLRQVPNQPLFDGMVEDEIISYTFEKYLKGEGEDWPLLQPMVKSAVRAMDAVQQYAKREWQQDIEKFVVTGASKRGWTTWLTGAVDSRVVAIAPMVIDVLNMPVQMERQMMSYGRYSEQIEDYSEKGIQAQAETELGKRLNALVDPYAYRDSLTMPKLLLLGTNDPYWTVDAANVYLKDLKGRTYVHYEPNAGHGLGPGAFPALLAFYQAILEDPSGATMPEYEVSIGRRGAISIQHVVGDSARAPKEINVWLARSSDRDFRDAKWEKHSMKDAPGVIANAGFSEMGYVAYFPELVFENEQGVRYSLSGPMTVLPEEFPYDAKGTKVARSEPRGEPEGNPYAPENRGKTPAAAPAQ